MFPDALGHVKQDEKLKLDCVNSRNPCFKNCLSICTQQYVINSGTERTVASKRRWEVCMIPLSLLTAAVDSSVQQSAGSRRRESGKNQT